MSLLTELCNPTDSRDKEPSENANTIVIETTVKSPEVKASAQTPPQEPDYGEGNYDLYFVR